MEHNILIFIFRRRKRTPKAEKPEEGGADSDAGGASPKKFTSLKPGRKPRRKPGRPAKSEGSTREGSPVEGTPAAAPGTPASTDGSQAGTEGETSVVKKRRGRKPKALLEQGGTCEILGNIDFHFLIVLTKRDKHR